MNKYLIFVITGDNIKSFKVFAEILKLIMVSTDFGIMTKPLLVIPSISQLLNQLKKY